ncbi:MAG: DUF4372 domain-containing protein [Calditrichota bacterium]
MKIAFALWLSDYLVKPFKVITMHQGKTVFAQLREHIPHYRFRCYVERYQGHKWVQTFSCWEQFLAMAFAQLTARRSLRDIEDSLTAQRHKLYHMGFGAPVKRATLAKANENRDCRDGSFNGRRSS